MNPNFKKKKELRKKKQLYNLVEQKSNGKIFCFENKLLNFLETNIGREKEAVDQLDGEVVQKEASMG